MAQGEQRRLARLGRPKQLLHVGAGEKIICRTKRLVLEVAPWARVVVIGRWRDFGLLPSLHPVIELEDPGHCVLDGVAAALAGERVLGAEPEKVCVLLGDVVWSRAALWGLLQDRRPVVFSGTRQLSRSQGEVFGLCHDSTERLLVDLQNVPCRRTSLGAPMRYEAGQRGGHLRNLLFYLQYGRGGVPRQPEGSTAPWTTEELYLPVDDWTTDVDTEEDVAALPGISAMVRADDAAEEGP